MSVEARRQITLGLNADDAALSVLIQGSSGPLIQGDDPEGFDYLCSRCGSLLVAQTTQSSLWDLAIECATCHAQSATPALPPGRALPPGTVVVDQGRYLAEGTIRQPSTATIASRQVVERRERETGRSPALGPRTGVLGVGMVQELLRQTEEMLGEVLEELERSHERSMASPTPGQVHPLIRYVEDVRVLERTLARGGQIGLSSLIELHSLIGQLERWQHDRPSR